MNSNLYTGFLHILFTATSMGFVYLVDSLRLNAVHVLESYSATSELREKTMWPLNTVEI